MTSPDYIRGQRDGLARAAEITIKTTVPNIDSQDFRSGRDTALRDAYNAIRAEAAKLPEADGLEPAIGMARGMIEAAAKTIKGE